MRISSNIRKWWSLVVLSLALAIIIIDTTILNVSLSTIIREFKTDIQSIQWVIAGYSLTLAALTITGGRLGDLFGRRRMFIVGAVIFAIGSFITSISHNVPVMIWGEAIIEGIGAALMMPATASLLVANFRGRERALAFGVWGGIAAASAAIGPIVGGYLTTHYSWRWGFRLNILVVLILLIGSILIPESRDQEEKPSLDFGGVVLSATGLLCIVFGFIEASHYGWWKALDTFRLFGHGITLGGYSVVPFALALGTVIIGLFLLWERYMSERGETPLVSLELFQNSQFSSGALTSAVLSLGQAGLIFSIPVFLQSVRHFDAYETGRSLLPMSLTLLVIAPLSAFLSNKIRPKYLIQIGLVLNVLSFIMLRHSLVADASLRSLAPGFIVFGMGIGLVIAHVSNLTLSAVSIDEAGEASGVNNTLRQIGSTLGSAIIGSILLTSLTANLHSGVLASSIIPISEKDQISQAVVNQVSNVEFNGGAHISQALSPIVRDEIARVSRDATVEANRRSLSFGILFAVLGLLVSGFLPNVRNVERHQSAARKK